MSGVYVLASGMVTPVGFNSEATFAAIRGGISGIATANLFDPESGGDLSAGRVSLPQWWEGLGKLAELGAPAIEECLLAAAPEAPDEIPILLGVAEKERPCRLQGLDHELLDEIEFRLGLQHHPESKVFPEGHTAGAVALIEAFRLLTAGKSRLCVVAGVDSYLQQEVVEAYMKDRRILTETNSNGFFPGEAGAALLLTAFKKNTREHLRVLGIGMSEESATISSDKAFRAEGLTDAIRQALAHAGLTMADIAYRITDLTGEHYKFKEAAFAAARFEDGSRKRPFDLWHPVEFLGEVGAAILPCIMGLALHASRKGYAPGDTALCHVGNDAGKRAALVVRFDCGG